MVTTGHQVRSYGPVVSTSDRTSGPRIPVYEIRVAGRLGSRWSEWFDGLIVTADDDGTTVIRGEVVDQAALHGLLLRLRDLGVVLLSLTSTPSTPSPEPPAPPTEEH